MNDRARYLAVREADKLQKSYKIGEIVHRHPIKTGLLFGFLISTTLDLIGVW